MDSIRGSNADNAQSDNNDSSSGGSANKNLNTSTLVEIAYGELHQLARGYMSRESSSHTLTPTALLNEAFLRLNENDKTQFNDLDHFVATAARVMRNVLVNHAKAKKTAKRGAGWVPTPLDTLTDEYCKRAGDLEELNECLERLETIDPVQRQLVDLRFFGGLTMSQSATALGL